MTNKILYLGLNPPDELRYKEITHCPLIRIAPRPYSDKDITNALSHIKKYTHFIFTSKSAVNIFFDYIKISNSVDCLKDKIFLSVGSKTTQQLKKHGIKNVLTASEETAEGIILLLASLNLTSAFIFWPHSALSRPILTDWLNSNQFEDLTGLVKYHYCACIFYDTVLNAPEVMPDLSKYDEIIFTSPSTVDAFCKLFGKLPHYKILSCIGSITQKHLDLKIQNELQSPSSYYKQDMQDRKRHDRQDK